MHVNQFNSINKIESKLQQFFDGEEFSLLDSNSPKLFSNGNIVVTGGFFKKFMHPEFWCNGDVKIYTLSRYLKENLISLFNLDPSHVEVIPREFFLEHRKQQFKIDLNKKVHFIYSGRITPDKNIELILKLVSYLQTKLDFNCDLSLYGSFDKLNPFYKSQDFNNEFQTDILKLVSKLNWKEEPQFKGACEDWTSQLEENSVFINLSKSYAEDFNMASIEAINAGIRPILIDWATFQDLKLSKSAFIPEFLTRTKYWNSTIEEAYLEILSKLIKEKLSLDCEIEKDDFTKVSPQRISVTDLESLKRHLIQKNPNEYFIYAINGERDFFQRSFGQKIQGLMRLNALKYSKESFNSIIHYSPDIKPESIVGLIDSNNLVVDKNKIDIPLSIEKGLTLAKK